VKDVCEWPAPKNKYEVRSYLSLCKYCRRFVSRFANIAKPLTKLNEKKRSFQWTLEVESAFQMLKGTLWVAPILAYPQPGERFIMDTDTSNVRIGEMLSQVQDG
jgi:hypothetical protein